jgi:hypothetical protein
VDGAEDPVLQPGYGCGILLARTCHPPPSMSLVDPPSRTTSLIPAFARIDVLGAHPLPSRGASSSCPNPMSQVFRNGSSFVNCLLRLLSYKAGPNFVTVDILQWTWELVLRVRFNRLAGNASSQTTPSSIGLDGE